MRFCTSIFLYWEELCSNNAKYIFGVCFTLLRHTFFMLKKLFKKLLKKYRYYQFLIHRFDIM